MLLYSAPKEMADPAPVDDYTRTICGAVISMMAFVNFWTNLVYIVACYKGRNKFGTMSYFSATKCLSECSLVLAFSQLAIILPSVFLNKWRFESYQDCWIFEAICLLHSVSNIGIMLFVILMSVESLVTSGADKPIFGQRYAMDILCWSLYCVCLAIATALQVFHQFQYENFRFYNSSSDGKEFSAMAKHFLDWERFVGLSFCFVIFWWQRAKALRNGKNGKKNSINSFNIVASPRNNRKSGPVQKKAESDTGTNGLTITIMCLIPAVIASIFPQVFRYNTNLIRFVAGVVQTGSEALLPSLMPLVHFYLNPKARQVLRQAVEQVQWHVLAFRRPSTDSIVVMNP